MMQGTGQKQEFTDVTFVNMGDEMETAPTPSTSTWEQRVKIQGINPLKQEKEPWTQHQKRTGNR